MTQVGLVVIAMLVAVGVSLVLRRRKADAPTQGGYQIPTQLDRGDFVSPETPWLVAIFTSATCDACADVANKAMVLASDDVAVQRIDYIDDPALHKRYKIDAVPTLVIVDHRGVVQKSFLGPMKAQDLWAAVAECREPGSTPDPCSSH
ncbi:MAG: thioredoxin family protein [Ilumatobacteraceae bacterium]|nr:thioredoxin family protein [Ilumatobacteraceae bacterium]